MTKKTIIITVTVLAIGASSVLLLTPKKPEPSLVLTWCDMNGSGHITGSQVGFILPDINWQNVTSFETHGLYGETNYYTNTIPLSSLSNTSQCFFRAYTK